MIATNLKLEKPPTETSSWDEPLSFRVWANSPAYVEDQKPWKVVAAFDYLLEALDYVAYCKSRGTNVVFQTPSSVEAK